jgi:hypothetical protein
MKRIFTLLALVLSGALSFAGTMTDNGRKLTELWAQYEEAHKADRPVKELEILKQIKEKAAAERLPVDFYDAATTYVSTVQRRDWKQREPALKDLAAEVKALDEPIVTFLWMNDYQNAATDVLWAYVQANIARFQGRNTPFYRSIGSYLGGNLAPFIQTDKEYVLWRMLTRRSYVNIEDDEIYQALKAEVAGRYPAEPALEYYVLNNNYLLYGDESAKTAALEALAAKYAGKAVSLYPRGMLLSMQMTRLNKEKAAEGEYRKLYAACEAFEQERKAFTGDEARILSGYNTVTNLCNQLTAKDLDVEVNRENATVTFQNLKQATLVLYKGTSLDGKKVKAWKLKNTAGSFYVRDTVKVAMPSLADGEYELVVSEEDETAYADYKQFTLSMATRCTADGWQVYVTDHRSGEPLQNVKLRLYKGGKQVATATMDQNGFTAMPKTIQKAIDKDSWSYFYLQAEDGKRSSGTVSLRENYYSWSDDGVRCNIYRDRGAYNPGDTLKFKVVLYEGDPRRSLSVCADKKITVELTDSEDNTLKEVELTTNEFGSASGSFVIPKGLRNGYFSLGVSQPGSSYYYAHNSFRVDEFVLPTFDLTFDEDEKLYLVGDKVPVSGKITSYSGHSVTGARVSAKVTRYDDVVFEDSQEVGPDNSFSFAFPARNSGGYHIEVTVTDATGETLSFTTYKYISDRIQVSIQVSGAAEGRFELADDDEDNRPYRRGYRPGPSRYIIDGNTLKVCLEVDDAEGGRIPVSPSFELLNEKGEVVRQGTVDSGTQVSIDLAGCPSGLYTLIAKASTLARDGKTELKDDASCKILLTRPGDRTLTPAVTRFYIYGPETVTDGFVSARLGSTYGKIWGVATLFGDDRKVLVSRVFTLEQGVPGEVGFAYAATYPDAVRLQVFYFQDGESVNIDYQYRRAKDKLSLPLRFTRFQSDAYPGTEYGFELQADAGVEALAAAWDKSLDAIAVNHWPVASMGSYTVPYISIGTSCGHVTGEKGDDSVVIAYGVSTRSLAKGAMADGMVLEEAMVALPAPMARNESADMISSEDPAEAEPVIRTEFSSALTFQPHLRSDADGTLSFKFRTSDKLSTYYVTVYAHGKDMRNALVQEEMVVSLPVKVALVQPQFLYAGDRYEAALTVSSISDEPVSGRLRLQYGSSMQEIPVTVPAGEVVNHRFLVEVPADAPAELTLTASFISAEFSDAVQVTVPVYPAAQVLTEAHSAVLLSGMDREALLKELRSRFVNVPGAEAVLKEVTVLDMVRDAIPSHVEPSGKDVLSLSEAWYVQLLSSKLSAKREGNTLPSAIKKADATGSVSPSLVPGAEPEPSELLEKVMACQNSDGGFGWFEGMNSSAIITAVLLERFAKLRDRGFEVPDMKNAVKFLDKTQFGTSFPLWRGWVSDAQYMHVRALYPEVPFTVKAVSKADKKRMETFTKDAKAYLLPSKKEGRGLQGQILSKARRLLTLKHLSESEAGVALSGAWGVTLDQSKLAKSMQADLLSLVEYAVEHRDGGWYYPNAVMPWRGLMESEAYAHALLCDLLSSVGDGVLFPEASALLLAEGNKTPSPIAIADGIRLWLMLQKETQKWETEPAYVDAITSILDGSKAVLDTRVLALSATYEAPFADIKAAGNGFTIERRFFKEVTEELVYDNVTLPKNRQVSAIREIKPGDPVKVGDKIVVEYRIWNGENRSFVKLDAGREASLRPVEQLSGHIGWGFRSFSPQGYRNVKADRTEYFFDSYPEEKTTVTESFFVTQAGAFVAPVITIESLYAPHYRANSASRGILVSEP